MLPAPLSLVARTLLVRARAAWQAHRKLLSDPKHNCLQRKDVRMAVLEIACLISTPKTTVRKRLNRLPGYLDNIRNGGNTDNE